MATPSGIAVATRQAASGYALRALPRRKTYTTSWDINTDRQLAGLAESCKMDMSSAGFDMSREADVSFAALVDYMRDYRDVYEDYPQSAKFPIYDGLQEHIDALSGMKVSLRFACREVAWEANPKGEPWRISLLYLSTCRAGKEPEQFTVTRKVSIGSPNP